MAPFATIYSYPHNFRVQRVCFSSFIYLST